MRSIYRDFERDGRIDDCDHTRARAQAGAALDRGLLQGGVPRLPRRADGGDRAPQRGHAARSRSRSSRTATATPRRPRRPRPAAPAADPRRRPRRPPRRRRRRPTSPDSGALPDFGSGGGGPARAATEPVDPLPEAPGRGRDPGGHAVADAGAPRPTPTPPPKLIVTRAAASPNMFVPGALLAVALIGLLIAAMTALDVQALGPAAPASATRGARPPGARPAHGATSATGCARDVKPEGAGRALRSVRPGAEHAEPATQSFRAAGGRHIRRQHHGADAADDHRDRTAQVR